MAKTNCGFWVELWMMMMNISIFNLQLRLQVKYRDMKCEDNSLSLHMAYKALAGETIYRGQTNSPGNKYNHLPGVTATTFSPKTPGAEVAETLREEITGKNLIITGTSLGGLGAEVAHVLARYTNLVIIAGPSDERQQLTIDSIKTDLPSANVRKLILDLSSSDAIRAAAAEVNAYSEPIHVLINNAAAAMGPYKETKDSHENQFSVDHLGHFLFTTLILPRIRAARSPSYSPRIINLSSTAHRGAGVRLDDVSFDRGKAYKIMPAYAQAKTANILFTEELAKRLKREGILAYAVDPGLVRLSNYSHLDAHDKGDERRGEKLHDKITWKTPQEGISTHIVAAFDPSIKDHSGSYLADCQVHNESVAPHASDPALAEKLWTLSEELLGESFPISP
ncbi:hypothetical protein BS47DRAFT_1342568 [Hydnum rufescens UP504]|uniref:Uncharacterized protein n=1 Tax=Hydnum rufescens UP504 TaxID=1448309 RepID=A0A9P6AZD0_9AGAM|nr:hypothetical protein BS47DRAFT_1342568 [Hydnum rufescens UP504]